MKRYIGEQIRKARKKRKLTLKEAAEKLDTNVSSLSKIERGEYEASYDLFEKLSNLYGVKISNFFGEKSTKYEEFEEYDLTIAKELRDSKLTEAEKKQIMDFIKFTITNHVE